MRPVIPVNPVTTPASKLTISPILVMACGFACSPSAFIVPSHDSVRTSALTGKAQINVKVTNSIRDMAAALADEKRRVWRRFLKFIAHVEDFVRERALGFCGLGTPNNRERQQQSRFTNC